MKMAIAWVKSPRRGLFYHYIVEKKKCLLLALFVSMPNSSCMLVHTSTLYERFVEIRSHRTIL